MESELDKEFNDAFVKISKIGEAIAPDIMLKFYAYNKQANFGNRFASNNEVDVRNAFKLNAWMQLNGMKSEEAKRRYIALAKTVLNTIKLMAFNRALGSFDRRALKYFDKNKKLILLIALHVLLIPKILWRYLYYIIARMRGDETLSYHLSMSAFKRQGTLSNDL